MVFPLRFLLLPVLCAVLSPSVGVSAPVVGSVEVEGTQRDLSIETKPGELFDPRVVSRDVRRLWETDRFDDIRVESRAADDEMHLVFRVQERRRFVLREVRFVPRGERRELTIEKGTPITEMSAHEAARALEKELASKGFPEAEVASQVIRVGDGQADLELRVERGPKLRIGLVELEGPLGIEASRLRKRMKATTTRRWLPGIPGIWKGWRSHAPYNQERIETDLAALRSYYLSQGYLGATVGLQDIRFEGSRATVHVRADAGPRYSIESSAVESPEGSRLWVHPSGGFDARKLCQCLLRERRQAEQEGRLDFLVRFEWELTEASAEPLGLVQESGSASEDSTEGGPGSNRGVPLARVVARVEPGPQYRVGRIEFRGNHKLRDTTLRKALKLDEGDWLDPRAVRGSVSRLNRFSMLEPLTENDVELVSASDGSVDVTFSVREQKHGRWSISGPLGPMGWFGPLRFSVESRLPAWGRGVLDLSTWMATAGLISFVDPVAGILAGESNTFWQPFVALYRPVLPGQPWSSGILLSPSLSWKGNVLASGALRVRSFGEGFLAPRVGGSGPLGATVWYRGAGGSTAAQPGLFVCERQRSRWEMVRSGAAFALRLAGGAL